ncbi:MAG: response regulator [Opitutae bacterium]|nr:response regulator [Opitutae bacterium]
MKTHSILLVEDNEDDVRLTQRALKKANIANALDVVGDGIAALAALRAAAAQSALPSIVLLDLKLPRLDGLGVLREIRADPRLRCQPVVVLTTSQEQQDVLQSYELGANSYVRKPVDFEQFAAAIQQLGLYWLVLNELPSAPATPPA